MNSDDLTHFLIIAVALLLALNYWDFRRYRKLREHAQAMGHAMREVAQRRGRFTMEGDDRVLFEAITTNQLTNSQDKQNGNH